MSSLAFHHVALACKDPTAVERFYTKHFGFKRTRVFDLGTSQIVMVKSGDVYLEIFQAAEAAPVPPAGNDGPTYPSLRHLAFRVDSVDAKLAEMGEDARPTLGPLSFDAFIPGWRTVWLADPDGNVVEISEGYRDE